MNRILASVVFACLATISYGQTVLNTGGSYIWNVNDLPRTFNGKFQFTFVSANEGFPSYGTVLAAGGYSNTQDGSAFQLYVPYSETYGGKAPQIRMGQYNNVGWTPWQTLFTSANANNKDTDWTARNISADGNIRTREVKVEATNWPDYVFQPDYKLMPLEELAAHIRDNGHLPHIPKAQDIEANGLALGEMNRTLVEKVEELTLYLLQCHEEIKLLQKEVQELKK